MISKQELQGRIADTLKEIRIKRGLSKAKIADMLYIDDKTWARYESGQTAPTVSEYLWIFSALGENALRSTLNVIYPSTYNSLSESSSIEDMRKAAAHYFLNVASDKTVQEWNYITFGNHGSSLEPQMQLFTMLNHLPLNYRVATAKLILTFWELCTLSKTLQNTDQVMPDVDLMKEGIKKATVSVMHDCNGYSLTID